MERLEILLNSKQIDKKTFLFLKKINKKIKKWSNNDKQRFLMHTAIAITRIKKQEKVNPLGSVVISQIIENPKYKKGCLLLKNLFKELNLKIPKNEKNYLLIHILKYVN